MNRPRRLLHLINTVYVRSPSDSGHGQIESCEPHEIAHPDKLAKITEYAHRSSHDSWRDTQFGKAAFIPWCSSFQCGATSKGFYVITTSSEMFAYDVKNHDWLDRFAAEYFIITTPILNQDGATYTINNLPNTDIIQLADNGRLRACIINEAFTICNGITFFLAMVRLGAISPPLATKMLVARFKNPDSIYIQIPQSHIKLYMMTRVTHIADYPCIYAVMGAVHDWSLACVLMRLWHTRQHDLIPCCEYRGTIYFTNIVCSHMQFMKRSDMHFLDVRVYWKYDRSTTDHDVVGFLRGIVSNPCMYMWWKESGKHILSSIVNVSQLLTSIIHYYDTDHARIMWNMIIQNYAKDDVLAFLCNDGNDDIPCVFVDDLLSTYKCHKELYRILRKKNQESPLGIYQRKIDARITTQLLLIKQLCPREDHWHPLRHFLQEHLTILHQTR